ncbi:MAG: hypothetical protein IJL20_02960 [Lachnospiraceae bacterium]|nr:hypothetical protein [Lachnospiraceae bacterium]
MRYHLVTICIYRYIRREEPTHKGRESLPPAQIGRRTASRQTATENKQPNDSRAEQKDGRHQANRKQTDSRAEKHQNKQPERANRSNPPEANKPREAGTDPRHRQAQEQKADKKKLPFNGRKRKKEIAT